jgi:hypothetical protein
MGVHTLAGLVGDLAFKRSDTMKDANPAPKPRAKSTGLSGAKRNKSRRKGTARADTRNRTVPPETHHKAGLRRRDLLKNERVQTRLLKIRPRSAITRVVKLSALASNSLWPVT